MGIRLPRPEKVSWIGVGRDGTPGGRTDRTAGALVLQFTTKAADHTTADGEWTTYGRPFALPSSSTSYWWLDPPVRMAAMRILVDGDTCLDEIELLRSGRPLASRHEPLHHLPHRRHALVRLSWNKTFNAEGPRLHPQGTPTPSHHLHSRGFLVFPGLTLVSYRPPPPPITKQYVILEHWRAGGVSETCRVPGVLQTAAGMVQKQNHVSKDTVSTTAETPPAVDATALNEAKWGGGGR